MTDQPQDAATRKRKRIRTTLNVSPELKRLLKLEWHRHCDGNSTDMDFEDYIDREIREKLLPSGSGGIPRRT